MVTISLCMIVKNEERVLARCLDSVQGIVDEIVIVDTGSIDGTIDIAKRYTEKVFSFVWQEDFSAARNESFSHAQMDYCLWLDADDVLEEEGKQKLLELKDTLSPQVDVVMLPYHTAFDEGGRPTFCYYRERLLRREAGFRWEGVVHEAITPQGKIVYGSAPVVHRKEGVGDPDRNLRIYEKYAAQGGELSPRDRFYFARELWYHKEYLRAEKMLEEFLASGQGWKENCLEACRVLAQCRESMGKEKEALSALTQALRYGPPRGELSCAIGDWFFRQKEYETALYWYDAAEKQEPDPTSGGFVQPDCYGYLPALQKSLCWYYLGNLSQAIVCNEEAQRYKPGNRACLYNRHFYLETAQKETVL